MITHIAMQRSSQRNTENSVPPQRIISEECPFVGLFLNISFETDANQPCCSDVYVMFRGDNKKFKNLVPKETMKSWRWLQKLYAGANLRRELGWWFVNSNLGSVVGWVSFIFLLGFSDHSQILTRSWNSRWYCVYIYIHTHIYIYNIFWKDDSPNTQVSISGLPLATFWLQILAPFQWSHHLWKRAFSGVRAWRLTKGLGGHGFRKLAKIPQILNFKRDFLGQKLM